MVFTTGNKDPNRSYSYPLKVSQAEYEMIEEFNEHYQRKYDLKLSMAATIRKIIREHHESTFGERIVEGTTNIETDEISERISEGENE